LTLVLVNLLILLSAPSGAQPAPSVEAPSTEAPAVASGEIATGPTPLAEPPEGSPPLEEAIPGLTREISHRLRCPVCQGLSIEESNADTSVAMKTRVRELVTLGYSAEQICAYFVDRYGAWILLDPPKTGVNWLVWAGPGVLVLIGGLAIASRVRRTAPTPEPRAPISSVDSGLRARVLAELGEGPERPVRRPDEERS
jgi:cytochrome c-type biogenesis protein CcmH